MTNKAIILVGGAGTRLRPLTQSISKEILPVYDKPMIYYPIANLISAGIKDILIISHPSHIQLYQELLGDGSDIGVNFTYTLQPERLGIANAFILGENFINNDNVCLILGDNIFIGDSLNESFKNAAQKEQGATIFGYQVHNPERYGVVEFDAHGKAVSIEEKPQEPKSNWAIPGLYFYDNQVVDIAKNIKPSARGELEITDISEFYMAQGSLSVELMNNCTWFDAGTHESLLDVGNFVETKEKRDRQKVGCIEQAAYEAGFINAEQIDKLAAKYKNQYGEYLKSIVY